MDQEVGKAVKRIKHGRERAMIGALDHAEHEGWDGTNTQRYLNWTYRLWTIRLFEARRQYQGIRWTDDTMGAAMPDHWGGPISGSLVRRIRRQGLDGYRWRPGGRPRKVLGSLSDPVAHKPVRKSSRE